MNQVFFGWLDTRDIPLSEKISAALRRYEQKFGKPPSIVETSLNEEVVEGMGIEVKRYRYILPNHILVGVVDEQTSDKE